MGYSVVESKSENSRQNNYVTQKRRSWIDWIDNILFWDNNVQNQKE